ncbi:LysE family translocator [Nocardia sp. NPDC052566]|uniref:LysE family translocator n=1 Tax=Nocardia sp. NPDC052566 TaxID=3364330 RepID=UPI0037CB3F84
MIPTGHLLAFLAASLVIILIPGPGVLFTIGRALALGRRAALISVLGHAAGVYVTLVLVAVGLGTLLAASALALTVVKFAGALYLVYLGVQAFRARKSLREALDGRVDGATDVRVFRQGLLVGLTNPKSIVFFAAVLPNFADPDAGSLPLQFLILGTIFLAIALVSDSTWGLAAAFARDWFAKSPKRLEAVGGAGGMLIVGLGASVALTGRAD